MNDIYYKDIIKSDFNITKYLKELISEIIDEKFGRLKEQQEIEKEKEEVINDLEEKEQPDEEVKIPIKYNYADIGIKVGDILYFYFQHDSSIAEEHQNDPPMTVTVLDPVKKYVKIMGNEYSTVNKFLVEKLSVFLSVPATHREKSIILSSTITYFNHTGVKNLNIFIIALCIKAVNRFNK